MKAIRTILKTTLSLIIVLCGILIIGLADGGAIPFGKLLIYDTILLAVGCGSLWLMNQIV